MGTWAWAACLASTSAVRPTSAAPTATLLGNRRYSFARSVDAGLRVTSLVYKNRSSRAVLWLSCGERHVRFWKSLTRVGIWVMVLGSGGFFVLAMIQIWVPVRRGFSVGTDRERLAAGNVAVCLINSLLVELERRPLLRWSIRRWGVRGVERAAS